IRLLDLKFGHDDEIISLGIEKYRIDDHPPYIALSYTWGDANDTLNLLCNGRIIAVTRNLHEALWQFRENRKRLARLKPYTRSRNQPLHFWVDAICINQGKNEEKSVQVGLMREIYQRANHVFVWLGPADKSSDVSHPLHQHHRVNSGSMWYPGCVRNVPQQILSASPGYGRAMKSLLDSVSGRNSQSNLLPITELKNFFTRSWWTRIWVLQEVALSRDTHFICGAQRLSTTRCNAFIHMYAALWKINATAFQIDQTNTKLYHFEIMKHLFHHRPTIMLSMPKICRDRAFPLAALLRATSTKPEDKIFALLGLAADREELKNFGVVPNYDVPYEQTYTTTMVALLRQGHISLLSMCQASRSPNLPSWVPDW
ncbi:heterokaryon incompatibility protein-domain-containing protein, partial [Bipolaris maydis]